MKILLEILYVIFIANTICIIVHEYGHAFAVWLFKAKVTTIRIGKGGQLFRIGKLEVHKMFWWTGRCSYEHLVDKKNYKSNIITFMGPFFNLVFTAIILVIGSHIYLGNIVNDVLLNHLMIVSFIHFIFNLIPMTSKASVHDGKKILDNLRSTD